MFENLSERINSVFGKLTSKGVLRDEDIDSALREVRIALLEADVALPVVRGFVADVQEKARGQDVIRSIAPGQQVVKIVHDELVNVLTGGTEGRESLRIDNPPATILVVGLQGSGKTTTTAKLAKRLQETEGKRVLMASLDVRRPAAMEQLAILGTQTGVDTLPIMSGEDAVGIARRACQFAAINGYDVLLLDTAGRLHADDDLMAEAEAVRDASNPRETLLVADGLTGQDAVNVARAFDSRIGVSGVILTRMDGDGRGGAALSMKAVTGKPILFVGLGEQVDALEVFHPERIAGRILGMGDIVTLVEKAQQVAEKQEAQRLLKRLRRGQLSMNDMMSYFEQINRLGGLSAMAGMVPGAGKLLQRRGDPGGLDRYASRGIALIQSMTPRERANPALLKASRKRRIARGAGLEVSDLNQLLKMHRTMNGTVKKMGRQGMLKAAAEMFAKSKGNQEEPDLKTDELEIPGLANLPGQLGGAGLPGGIPGLALPRQNPGMFAGRGRKRRKKR